MVEFLVVAVFAALVAWIVWALFRRAPMGKDGRSNDIAPYADPHSGIHRYAGGGPIIGFTGEAGGESGGSGDGGGD